MSFNVPLKAWRSNRWHNSPLTWRRSIARILVHPDDGGLLCFHANGELYRCITFNFGARASGWYWGRLAGLMVRSCHSLLAHGHALWQYVDDLLAWASSPLWASLIVVLLLILGVPMSWHKAALSDTIDWIGWRISVSYWTIEVPFEKLERITAQIRSIQSSTRLTLRDLQSLVGRLLWLTSAWWHLRQLLIPLYKALHRIPITMVGMDHVTFQNLTAQLDDQLQLRNQLTHTHQSLRKGVTLCRVANTNVNTLTDVKLLHIKSRRVWVGLSDPSTPNRKLDDEAAETLKICLQLLISTPFSLSMCPPDWIQVHATADAMASQSMAGLGGAAIFPVMVLPLGFSFAYHWLMLNRYGRGWVTTCKNTLQHGNCSHSLRYPSALPPTCLAHVARLHVIKPQIIAQPPLPKASPWLRPWRRCRLHISNLCDDIKYIPYPHITHIPGRLNVLADELSRFKETLSIALDPKSQRTIPWIELLQSSGIEITQVGRKWPSQFDIHLREKGLLQSADWVLPSISFWGVLTPAGRWSIYLVLFELPTSTGWPQHTPVIGLLTGVSLNGVLYLRSCCT